MRILTPHSCRHTYVSQIQALGVDLQTIQSIVGHADIDMTQHYLHVQDSIRKSAVSDYVVTYITHPWGGAYQYAEKARRQKKDVINL